MAYTIQPNLLVPARIFWFPLPDHAGLTNLAYSLASPAYPVPSTTTPSVSTSSPCSSSNSQANPTPAMSSPSPRRSVRNEQLMRIQHAPQILPPRDRLIQPLVHLIQHPGPGPPDIVLAL